MVAIGLIYYVYMLVTGRSLTMPGADQPAASGAQAPGGT
jgi:hypothetical protein